MFLPCLFSSVYYYYYLFIFDFTVTAQRLDAVVSWHIHTQKKKEQKEITYQL